MTDSVKESSTYRVLASLLSVFTSLYFSLICLYFFNYLPIIPLCSFLFLHSPVSVDCPFCAGSFHFPSTLLCVLTSRRSIGSELISVRPHMRNITPTISCLWILHEKLTVIREIDLIRSTRKILYLYCSRYSSDSSVSHFNLLSSGVAFHDDTYYAFC